MTTITNKEIDILVEALEAWEQKGTTGRLMSGLVGAMLKKDLPEEAQAQLEQKEKEMEEEYEQKKRERKEKAILLKAKLITLKEENILGSAKKIIEENKQ